MLPPVFVSTQLLLKVSDRIDAMIHKQPRDVTLHNLEPQLRGYFLRIEERWIGSAEILRATKHKFILSRNGNKDRYHLIRYRKYSMIPSSLQIPMMARLRSQNR